MLVSARPACPKTAMGDAYQTLRKADWTQLLSPCQSRKREAGHFPRHVWEQDSGLGRCRPSHATIETPSRRARPFCHRLLLGLASATSGTFLVFLHSSEA